MAGHSPLLLALAETADSDTSNCAFNNAKNMVRFVDGHVSHIKMYLRQPRADTISIHYDPPAEY